MTSARPARECHKDIYDQWNSLGAPLLVVQQPVVPQVDRVHAGRGRHASRQQVVRGLPRPRRLLQRPLRPADQGADRHARGAERPRLHVVPLDRARAAARWARATSTIEYPPLHDLAVSENPVLAWTHDYLLKLDPEPHRRDVPEALPPRADGRVLLVVPQGAPRRAGERLPLVPRLQRLRQLAGLGRVGPGRALLLLPAEAAEVRRLPHAAGRVERSGGDATARCTRTASRRPTRRCRSSNGDHEQLARHAGVPEGRRGERRHLRPRAGRGAGAARRERARRRAPSRGSPAPSRSGEEGGNLGAAASVLRDAAPVVAPLGKVDAALRRGESARVDVVVRTRKIGHFFPGGTVDAFDVWVELEAVDANGRTVFHSGEVLDGGKGPVEPGAHFYRSLHARRARQPDQQAQRLGHALGRLRAPDPARAPPTRSTTGCASPRTAATRITLAREGQLPQVHVVEHAVGLRRRARSRSTRTSRSPRATTTAAGSSPATRPRSRARSRASPTCRSP